MHIKIVELLKLSSENKPSASAIIKTLRGAYKFDKVKTLQLLLYIRDKNNWAGKREFTRACLMWLKRHDEDTFNYMLRDFLLVGRWDDIFFSPHIINDRVLWLIKTSLVGWDTLLRKWLPKERTEPVMARVIAKGIWLTMKEYRVAIKKTEGTFVNTLYRSIDSYNINLPKQCQK